MVKGRQCMAADGIKQKIFVQIPATAIDGPALAIDEISEKTIFPAFVEINLNISDFTISHHHTKDSFYFRSIRRKPIYLWLFNPFF